MSSQPEHPTLLIPGPIEFDDAVLQSMSHFSESHVGPGFVNTFGETLSMTRKLFQTTASDAQPFILSGSGTLGWDIVAANLVEAGEDVLVLSTGYFGDGFADCFKAYGANVDVLKGPAVGTRPQLPEIEKALKSKKYKVITVTHVDTSTGVLSELKEFTKAVNSVSPDTLVIVDGVCSVACEEIAFDDWKIDGVVTASQKAIGCPAGLSISMFSGRAIAAVNARKTPPATYFASIKNWLPSMFSPVVFACTRAIANSVWQLCKTTRLRSLRTLPHHRRSSFTPSIHLSARSLPSRCQSVLPNIRRSLTRSRRPLQTWGSSRLPRALRIRPTP